MSSSGDGISARWASRISTISAAARALPARATSSAPASKTCQTRDKMRVDNFSAASMPRLRNCAEKAISSCAAGTNFSRVSQCVSSAISAKMTAGSAPITYCASNSAKAALTEPAMTKSKRSKMRPRSASPKRPRMVASSTAPLPAGSICAKARSSKDRASRAEPSAARAISFNASSGKLTFSALQVRLKRVCVSSKVRRRKSKRWQRDNTVTGTWRISVVAKMNFTCAGGSSSVFSNPLKAAFDSICTSSII